jgi:hypothetical protein
LISSMDCRPPRSSFALSLAALAGFSVTLQCWLSVQLAVHNGRSIGAGLETFFSYFTVLTNTSIFISLTLTLIGPASSAGKWCARPGVVAGIAANISFVALSYHFLLRNTWNPQGAQLLADLLLHYAVPALYVLYWWSDAAKTVLRWTHPLLWSSYPAAYLAYSLARGYLVGSYPYPFIDAGHIGYARTMQNALGLLIVFIVLGLLIVALGRVRQRIGR